MKSPLICVSLRVRHRVRTSCDSTQILAGVSGRPRAAVAPRRRPGRARWRRRPLWCATRCASSGGTCGSGSRGDGCGNGCGTSAMQHVVIGERLGHDVAEHDDRAAAVADLERLGARALGDHDDAGKRVRQPDRELEHRLGLQVGLASRREHRKRRGLPRPLRAISAASMHASPKMRLATPTAAPGAEKDAGSTATTATPRDRGSTLGMMQNAETSRTSSESSACADRTVVLQRRHDRERR